MCRVRLKQPTPVGGVCGYQDPEGGLHGEAAADFLSEASIMGQFDHPNIIQPEEVVTVPLLSFMTSPLSSWRTAPLTPSFG